MPDGLKHPESYFCLEGLKVLSKMNLVLESNVCVRHKVANCVKMFFSRLADMRKIDASNAITLNALPDRMRSLRVHRTLTRDAKDCRLPKFDHRLVIDVHFW